MSLRAAALTGPVAAIAALAGFGLAHALIITPIWAPLLRGLPSALIGGIGLAVGAPALIATAGPLPVGQSTLGLWLSIALARLILKLDTP